MKAWQFTRAHQPLALVDVPEPTPRAGEVLIDIRAAGLCHSDVGLLNDDDSPLPPGASTPLTLGHEIAGVISELGQGVTGWAIGDRVGIANTNPLTVPGLARDGGYSFKLTAETETLVPIPKPVTFEQATVSTDAGMTAYHAVGSLALPGIWSTSQALLVHFTACRASRNDRTETPARTHVGPAPRRSGPPPTRQSPSESCLSLKLLVGLTGFEPATP